MATHNPLSRPCKEREEDLVLFHYSDLQEPERIDLKDHLGGCAGCTAYLKELSELLPLTVKVDQPPEAFWRDYNRELRRKIDAVREKKSWRQHFAVLFQPRLLPAFGVLAVLALVLTLTLGRGIWQSHDAARDDEALMEVLPVAENLEFFKTMDVLDNLDVLESMGNQGGPLS